MTLPGGAVCNDQALPSSKVDLSKLSHLGNFYGWFDSAQIFCGFDSRKSRLESTFYGSAFAASATAPRSTL